MTLYPTPVPASYTYWTRNYDGSYNRFYASVLILGETEKSYLVQTSVPLGSHRAGDRLTVRKHNVKPKGQSRRPSSREHDYTNEFWNQ